jgi:putative alpha-1,2-mannosidase
VALGRKVTTQLTVTTRTGLARFTFPSTSQANVLLKVADSANPASRSSFRIVGRDQISGQVTSGQFCSTGTAYTLYFTARFNRPFASVGAWSGSTVAPGLRHCAGTACGAFVSFDARTNRQVEMKVGISFVSAADAAQNLRTEDPDGHCPSWRRRPVNAGTPCSVGSASAADPRPPNAPSTPPSTTRCSTPTWPAT